MISVLRNYSYVIAIKREIIILNQLYHRSSELIIVGSSLLKEVGLDCSILEGDFEIVINALKNGDMLNSALGHFLIDTLSSLNSLQSWSLSHTPRLGNVVVDALARRAKFSDSLSVWLDFVPPDIVNFVNVNLPAP